MQQYSQNLASNIVGELFDKAWHDYSLQQFLNKNLTNYSALKSLKFVDHVQEQESRLYQQINPEVLQGQPNPLIIDSLLPISADIDENTKSKSNKQLTQTSRVSKIINNSTLKLSKNNSILEGGKSKKQSEYTSLGYIPEEQQAIFKELRKQHEDQMAKEEAEKVKKQKEREVGKGKKEGKDEKLSFDYNGQIVRLRIQNRANLVGGGVNGQTSNSIVKIEEKKKKYPPTKIQHDKKGNQLSKIKKSQIFFSQTATLFSDAIASKGTRLKQGNLTIQEKQRVIPAKQLKKSLSNRRLTKDQFKRVKELTGNLQNFQITIKDKSIGTLEESSRKDQIDTEQKISHMRSASQSKLSYYNKKSSITINDPQLLDNLINGPVNQAQQRVRKQSQHEEDEHKEKLNTVDSYNLEYVKKGPVAMSKNIKSSADLGLTLRLPKIKTTSRSSIPISKPREKIRLNFQEKLKI